MLNNELNGDNVYGWQQNKTKTCGISTLLFLAYLVTQTVHLKDFIFVGPCPDLNCVYLPMNLNLVEKVLTLQKTVLLTRRIFLQIPKKISRRATYIKRKN